MMIVTTETVPGETIEKILGLVVGGSVRAAHLGTDVTVMMKNAVGGEIHEYTKILAEAREQALDRLKAQARTKGADAVIGLRFATSEICASKFGLKDV